jgi:ribosomal protein S27E
MDMKMCKKCNVHLENKGKLTSGNSNFLIWRCPSCGHEEMVCIGVIKR